MAKTAKLDFLLCGSPTPAFFSQMAFFRLCLDALGGCYRDARMVCTFGDHEREYLPPRWKRHFSNIAVEWAHAPGAPNPGYAAQHDRRFERIRPDADLAILCDADVALLRPFDDLIGELAARPALAGVIAHRHFPWGNFDRPAPGVEWPILAKAVIGKTIALPHRYTLGAPDAPPEAPFYINYGMLAGAPDLLEAFYARDAQIRPRVTEFIDPFWAAQVSLPLTCADIGLPTRALPMRYNFPNDPVADALYPEELRQAVFLHYLRPTNFRRETVFADPAKFDEFCAGRFGGSDKVLQDFVLRITGGEYPFAD